MPQIIEIEMIKAKRIVLIILYLKMCKGTNSFLPLFKYKVNNF